MHRTSNGETINIIALARRTLRQELGVALRFLCLSCNLTSRGLHVWLPNEPGPKILLIEYSN